MKKQVIVLVILVLILFLSGCKSLTTGKVATDVTVDTAADSTVGTCDESCQQEKDDYITNINSLLTQAQVITAKTVDWKSITKKDLADITSLKDQVSLLKVPQDFEMVHDYYLRAFNHYVEAVNYVVTANEKYESSSDNLNLELRNAMLTSVLDKVQEARKTLVYADEEVKFATNIIPKA